MGIFDKFETRIETKEHKTRFSQFLYVEDNAERNEVLLTVNKGFVESMGYDMAFFEDARTKGFESLRSLFKDDIAQDNKGGFFIVPVKERGTFEIDLETDIEKDIDAQFMTKSKPVPDQPKHRKNVFNRALRVFAKS